MDKEARRIRGKHAAHVRWAHCDPVQGTEAMRAGLQAKFEREVDPEWTLTPRERARRAENVRKAHMLKMTAASLKALERPDDIRRRRARSAERVALNRRIAGKQET